MVWPSFYRKAYIVPTRVSHGLQGANSTSYGFVHTVRSLGTYIHYAPPLSANGTTHAYVLTVRRRVFRPDGTYDTDLVGPAQTMLSHYYRLFSHRYLHYPFHFPTSSYNNTQVFSLTFLYFFFFNFGFYPGQFSPDWQRLGGARTTNPVVPRRLGWG